MEEPQRSWSVELRSLTAGFKRSDMYTCAHTQTNTHRLVVQLTPLMWADVREAGSVNPTVRPHGFTHSCSAGKLQKLIS